MTDFKCIVTILIMASAILLRGQDKPLVVASASMIADMTRQMAGDKVNVRMIVPIGGDPHLYEPTPRDVQMVNNADLILVNGLTFEGWINELIANSGTKADVVVVTEGLEPLSSQTYKNSVDPHAWMSVENGKQYARNIAQALKTLDPVNQNFYQQNLARYLGELTDLDQYILKAIASIPEKRRVLITSHDAFQYYGKRYGIKLEAIMGISTEAEPQTSDILRVSRTIRESEVPAVFIESTINPKLIEQIAKDNKVHIGGKLYADSLGDDNSPANTYVNMLRYNTDTIVEALSQDHSSADNSGESGSLMPYVYLGLLSVAILIVVLIRLNK